VIELPTFDFNIRQHNNNNNGGDAASQMLELNGGLFNIPRNLNRTSAPRCPSTADDCRSIKNPVALLGFAREKKVAQMCVQQLELLDLLRKVPPHPLLDRI